MSAPLFLKSVLLTAACIIPAIASAQTIGGAVPPYQAPAPVPPPQRSEGVAVPAQREDVFKARDQMVQDFAAAYQRVGRPRLALYWNRQLTEALNDWYSDSRTLVTRNQEGSLSGNLSSDRLSGDLRLNQQGSDQTSIEVQRRTTTPPNRLQPSESWEWQFQEGFLQPFLKSGATVVDRTAITRIMGAMTKGVSEMTVETMALQGYADFLMEILVAPQGQSTTGYELRARILDVKTGRIVSYVNSRGLRDWNQPKPAIATNRGFELPEDEDDETFGPQSAETRYRATPQGFVRNRKPPKLSVISQNLAYNVMDSLVAQWR